VLDDLDDLIHQLLGLNRHPTKNSRRQVLQPAHFLERIGTAVAGRSMKLLHVEDDGIQHRLTMFHLKKDREFEFTVSWAESQDDAVREFQRDRKDLVILDYHLREGNGLHCQKELRALDPIVPIVALSASKDAEIAAQLIRAGADDCLEQSSIRGDGLRLAIVAVIARADLVQQKAEMQAERDLSRFKFLIHSLAGKYLDAYDPGILQILDDIESTARRVSLSPGQRQAMLNELRAHEGSCLSGTPALERIVYRPLRLELEMRIGPDERAPCQCGDG
jgi:DNA-binding NarL/FixJ family response regulator